VTRQLTRSRYDDLCALMGGALDHYRPHVQEIGQTCRWPVGVYLLGHRHPESNGFVVDYVGSAIRSGSDISARVREHLRDSAKRARLSGQVILPLRHDIAHAEVRRLEGAAARALGVPPLCSRVPGGRRPRI
jgi:hypothetical protein